MFGGRQKQMQIIRMDRKSMEMVCDRTNLLPRVFDRKKGHGWLKPQSAMSLFTLVACKTCKTPRYLRIHVIYTPTL